MGKIVVSQNVTLDGVMQSPGPTDVPFKYRGWAVDFDLGREGESYALESTRKAEALLLGRITFEAMQAFWPTADGELAGSLNDLPKYVVSSTLTNPPWNTTVLGADWLQRVTDLRTELDGDIVVYGSRRMTDALVREGLVDELRLLVFPLVLGTGDRLFTERPDKLTLRLVDSAPIGTGGVISLIYALAT